MIDNIIKTSYIGSQIRRLAKEKYGFKYIQKIESKKNYDARKPTTSTFKTDPNEAVFETKSKNNKTEDDEDEEDDE